MCAANAYTFMCDTSMTHKTPAQHACRQFPRAAADAANSHYLHTTPPLENLRCLKWNVIFFDHPGFKLFGFFFNYVFHQFRPFLMDL